MASTWESERKNKDGSISYILHWRDHAGKTGKKAFRKKKERKAYKIEIEQKLMIGERIAKDITFLALAERWLNLKKAAVRPKTFTMYHGHFKNYLAPAFGPFKVKQIHQEMVEVFMADLSKAEIATETQRKILNSLKSVLNKAVEWKYIASNPAEFVKPPKKRKKEIEILTPIEMEMLIEATDERYRPLIATGYYAGLRISEIFGLKWYDVNFAKSKLRIRQTSQQGKFYDTKSESSRRTIDIPNKLVDILLKHLSSQRQKEITNKDNLVFPNSRGKHMNYQNFLSRVFLPAIEKAGLKRVTPHALRHSYVAAMISAGQNIKYIQRQLGHSDIRLTLDTYGHLLPDAEKDAAEKLDRVFATTQLPQEEKSQKNREL